MIDLAPLYRAMEAAPTPADRDALSTIAAMLSGQQETKSQQRAIRMDWRDVLIGEALPLMGVPTAGGAAVELARRWTRYHGGADWRADQQGGPPDNAGTVRRLLYGITAAHGRQPLSADQLERIGRGERTPVPA